LPGEKSSDPSIIVPVGINDAVYGGIRAVDEFSVKIIKKEIWK